MTRIDLHPEDLLDRALNGVASREERARLDAHLRICPACRLEHAVATDCRRSAAPQPGDDLVLARLRMSVTSAFQKRRYRPSLRTPRPRRIRVFAVAALLLFTALAAAAVLMRVYRTEPRATEQAPVVVEHARTPVSAPKVDEVPAASAPEAPPVEVHPHHHAVVAENRAAPEAPADGAKEMFARANTLRRQGSMSDAVQAYRALEQAFPGSAEALLSRVTLGRLLLDRGGDAGGALGEFNAYLGRAPHGALAEEALIGRALSLGRLGRTADERKAWERLLAEHPGSTYAARARARVEQLSAK